MTYLLRSDDFNPVTGQLLVIEDGATGLVSTTNATSVGDVDGPVSSTDNAVARFNGTTGKIIQNSVVVIDDVGNVTSSNANSGAALVIAARNTSNTASSTAGFVASVGGSSAGDPYVQFVTTGEQTWTSGIDNSVGGNPYVIAASTALGTTNALSITTAGTGTFTGAVIGTTGVTATTGNIAASAGAVTAATSMTATLGNITATNGNLVLGTAGNKVSIATGANASTGTSAAMSAGTITISTTAVTASSLIFVSVNTVGGTQGTLSAPTASIVAATSFVINSSNSSDTSTVNWWIVN